MSELRTIRRMRGLLILPILMLWSMAGMAPAVEAAGSLSPASSVLAVDYFWVGGTGNWSDHSNHWATVSGGSIFHPQVPTEFDNVIFDANSFSTTGQVVTVDVNAFCNDFSVLAVTDLPEIRGVRSVAVSGNFNAAGAVRFNSGSYIIAGTTVNFSDGVTGNLGGISVTTAGVDTQIGSVSDFRISSISSEGGLIVGPTAWFRFSSASLEGDFVVDSAATFDGISTFLTMKGAAGGLFEHGGHTMGSLTFGDHTTTAAVWALDTDLTVNNTLTLNGGTLESSGHRLDVGSFRSTTSTVRTLDLTGTDRITTHQDWDLSTTNLTLLTSSPDVFMEFDNVRSRDERDFNGGNGAYGDLTINDACTDCRAITVQQSSAIGAIVSNIVDNPSLRLNYGAANGDLDLNFDGAGSATITYTSGNRNIAVTRGGSGGSVSISGAPTYGDISVDYTLPSTPIFAFGSVSFSGVAAGSTVNSLDVSVATDGIKPSITLFRDNTFGTVTIPSGSDVRFGANQTQTFTTLTMDSTCLRPTSLHSTTAGTVATISQATGTVLGNNLELQDLAATGGATFTAVDSIDFGNVTGWNVTSPPSGTRYWIGGTGNWSDPNNWASSSGGTPLPGECNTPTQFDSVVFDANSFTGPFQTVTLDVSASVVDMTWDGVTGTPRFSGFFALTLYGSLTLDPNMTWSYSQDVLFEAIDTGHTVDTAGISMSRGLIFRGQHAGTGEWTLLSDFTGSQIRLESGSFVSGGFDLDVGGFYSWYDHTRSIDFTGSTEARLSSRWEVKGTNLTSFEMGTMDVIFDTTGTARFDAGPGQRYNDVVLDDNSTSTSSSGEHQFDNMTDVTFNDIIIDTLSRRTVEFENMQNVVINDIRIDAAQFVTMRFSQMSNATVNDIFMNGPNTLRGTFGFSGGSTVRDLDANLGTNGILNLGLDTTFRNASVVYGGSVSVGRDSEFDELVVRGSATSTSQSLSVGGDATFGVLDIGAGTAAFFANNKTQTVGSLLLDATCGRPIGLKSFSAGQPWTISQATGTVSGSFLILQDSQATGGATFTALETADLGNNTGWNISATPPRNFYWIGGAGNWSDGSNWSLSSGGPSFDCGSPTVRDSVIFDVNSFDGPSQQVTVNAAANIVNMRWSDVIGIPKLRSGTIQLTGSLQLDPDMIVQFTSFNFVGDSPATIDSAGVPLYFVTVDNIDGTWNLLSEMEATGFTFRKGTFISDGHDLRFGSFSGTATTAPSLLDLRGTKEIQILGPNRFSWSFNGPPGSLLLDPDSAIRYDGTLSTSSSAFRFLGGGQAYGDLDLKVVNSGSVDIDLNDSSSAPDSSFRDVSLDVSHSSTTNHGNIDIKGTGFRDVSIKAASRANIAFWDSVTYNDVTIDIQNPSTFHSNVYVRGNSTYNDFSVTSIGTEGPWTQITGDNTFANLVLAGLGSRVYLSGGRTQNVDNFLALGSGGFPVFVHSASPGVQTTINQTSGKTCLDFVWLKDVVATGGGGIQRRSFQYRPREQLGMDLRFVRGLLLGRWNRRLDRRQPLGALVRRFDQASGGAQPI